MSYQQYLALLAASGPSTGSIIAFGNASVPSGYLACDGAAVSRATYAALFTAIGTAFGVGDGSTTFNVPDCKGRVVGGTGTGSGLTARALAAKVGEESHALTIGELAQHSHAIPTISNVLNLNPAPVSAVGSADAADGSLNTGDKGLGTAHNTMQPSIFCNYGIKT